MFNDSSPVRAGIRSSVHPTLVPTGNECSATDRRPPPPLIRLIMVEGYAMRFVRYQDALRELAEILMDAPIPSPEDRAILIEAYQKHIVKMLRVNTSGWRRLIEHLHGKASLEEVANALNETLRVTKASPEKLARFSFQRCSPLARLLGEANRLNPLISRLVTIGPFSVPVNISKDLEGKMRISALEPCGPELLLQLVRKLDAFDDRRGQETTGWLSPSQIMVIGTAPFIQAFDGHGTYNALFDPRDPASISSFLENLDTRRLVVPAP